MPVPTDGGVQVTPQELADAGGALRGVAGALNDSLVRSDEPSLLTPEPYAEIMFGPADQVAAQYARLTRDLAKYVQACTDRLNAGADVFSQASEDFQRHEDERARAMGGNR